MKIAIDAGHGLYTSGKRCLKSIDKNETREWKLNQRIAGYVTDHLERCGCEVLRTDDISGQTDVPLATRSNKINSWGANYSISIHHDSGVNGGSGGGCTVFVYNGEHSSASDVLQKNIYSAVIDQTGKFGNRSNPLNSANFHMVRVPKCPSVLIECGFMDSKIDTPMILTDDFAQKCAVGIAKGICKTAGIQWVDNKEDILNMTNAELEALVDLKVNAALVKLTDISGTGDHPSNWAKEACEWAKSTGLFAGDGHGNYGWKEPVTREQMAYILKAFK